MARIGRGVSLLAVAWLLAVGPAAADWSPDVSLKTVQALMAPPSPEAKPAEGRTAATDGFDYDFMSAEPSRWRPTSFRGNPDYQVIALADFSALWAERKRQTGRGWQESFPPSYVSIQIAFIPAEKKLLIQLLRLSVSRENPGFASGPDYAPTAESAPREATRAEIAYLKKCLEAVVAKGKDDTMSRAAAGFLERIKAAGF